MREGVRCECWREGDRGGWKRKMESRECEGEGKVQERRGDRGGCKIYRQRAENAREGNVQERVREIKMTGCKRGEGRPHEWWRGWC